MAVSESRSRDHILLKTVVGNLHSFIKGPQKGQYLPCINFSVLMEYISRPSKLLQWSWVGLFKYPWGIQNT